MREATFLRSRTSGTDGSTTASFFDVWEGGPCWTSDFCVWSLLETNACSVAHTSEEALKRSLVREWPKYLRNTTVPLWTNYKKDLTYWLMLREAILKNEVIDWFLYIFPIILYIFCYLGIFWIIKKTKKISKNFLSTLYYIGKWIACLVTVLYNLFLSAGKVCIDTNCIGMCGMSHS